MSSVACVSLGEPDLRLSIRLENCRAEGEPATEGTETETAIASRLRQNLGETERNAGRRSVAVMTNVAVDARLNSMLDGVQDSLIRLVRDNQVELIDVEPLLVAHTMQTGDHRPDCFAEYLASLHLDEPIVQQRNGKSVADVALGRKFGSMQTSLGVFEVGFTVEYRG